MSNIMKIALLLHVFYIDFCTKKQVSVYFYNIGCWNLYFLGQVCHLCGNKKSLELNFKKM